MTRLGQHPRLYGWLAADLVVLAAYGVCRGNRAWMNAFASQVTGPLKEALGRLCYRTEISVMEVLAAALVIGAVLYILGSVVMVVRTSRERRGRRAWGAVLGALCTGLLIWDGFCLLWGVNYWTDSFQDLSGIYAQPVRQEDLTAVTAEFAQKLAQAAGEAAVRDTAYFEETRGKIMATRTWVTHRLREMGFQVHDSSSNFLFIAHPDHSGRVLQQGLRDRGVLVRRFERPRIQDHLRVSIGTDEEMEAMCRAMEEILKGQ